ncbi:hypothetical protein M409DRAFT_18254 [Zasmidium cellare ATCC 36951]|uniref:Uncharacterized protein n=1 Tax=Zasmidium cellare ATCC 36951 TaxID=1080233 RepID=A0A6A6CY98_ZASCE|nr:uncharacterized protein M409DRAFT_18254 [Zasmidium cellare ATCC 36951]KAF2172025.1 hypothetical protein M409DRAFT_18254 [Zasmidium cellare ATCC 36951]
MSSDDDALQAFIDALFDAAPAGTDGDGFAIPALRHIADDLGDIPTGLSLWQMLERRMPIPSRLIFRLTAMGIVIPAHMVTEMQTNTYANGTGNLGNNSGALNTGGGDDGGGVVMTSRGTVIPASDLKGPPYLAPEKWVAHVKNAYELQDRKGELWSAVINHWEARAGEDDDDDDDSDYNDDEDDDYEEDDEDEDENDHVFSDNDMDLGRISEVDGGRDEDANETEEQAQRRREEVPEDDEALEDDEEGLEDD